MTTNWQARLALSASALVAIGIVMIFSAKSFAAASDPQAKWGTAPHHYVAGGVL